MSKRKTIPPELNPVGYDDLVREFFRESPKDVDGVYNESSIFYNRELLREIFSCYEFIGVPDSWDYDYMLTRLFVNGYFTITDTPVGVIPLQCGITGVNWWNHPTGVNVAVPILGNFTRTIDEDCALIKLQYDYSGVMPLIQRYSTMLAMCDSAVAVNLMNSKAAIIAQAEDNKQAQTFKKMFDEISAGKPFVVTKNNLVKMGESVIFNPVKQAFVADDIHIVKEKIMNEFLTRIGIRSANSQKREHMITDEVNAINEESLIAGNHWIESVNDGLDTVRRLYGIDLTFRKKKIPELQEVKNESE